MDIQKEREAFEAWYCRNHTGLKQSDLAKFRTLSGYSFSDSLKINISWEAWQAAKAQAVPEGFVLVKKELPEQIAEKMAIDRIDKPRHENDPVWREIAEQSYKDQVKSKKWEFWRDYKAMIEAQEPAND